MPIQTQNYTVQKVEPQPAKLQGTAGQPLVVNADTSTGTVQSTKPAVNTPVVGGSLAKVSETAPTPAAPAEKPSEAPAEKPSAAPVPAEDPSEMLDAKLYQDGKAYMMSRHSIEHMSADEFRYEYLRSPEKYPGGKETYDLLQMAESLDSRLANASSVEEVQAVWSIINRLAPLVSVKGPLAGIDLQGITNKAYQRLDTLEKDRLLQEEQAQIADDRDALYDTIQDAKAKARGEGLDDSAAQQQLAAQSAVAQDNVQDRLTGAGGRQSAFAQSLGVTLAQQQQSMENRQSDMVKQQEQQYYADLAAGISETFSKELLQADMFDADMAAEIARMTNAAAQAKEDIASSERIADMVNQAQIDAREKSARNGWLRTLVGGALTIGGTAVGTIYGGPIGGAVGAAGGAAATNAIFGD